MGSCAHSLSDPDNVALVLKTWLATFIALLAGIGTVVGVATIWSFYPIGVIVVLAAALAAAVWIAWQTSRRAQKVDPTKRAYDAQIVQEIRGAVDDEDVTWLRGWDFGTSWPPQRIEPFSKLKQLEKPENEPYDRELAAALKALLDETGEFLECYANSTFSFRHGLDIDRKRNIGQGWREADNWEGEQREEAQQRLNDGGKRVVGAYDAVVARAKGTDLLRA